MLTLCFMHCSHSALCTAGLCCLRSFLFLLSYSSSGSQVGSQDLYISSCSENFVHSVGRALATLTFAAGILVIGTFVRKEKKIYIGRELLSLKPLPTQLRKRRAYYTYIFGLLYSRRSADSAM